MLRLVLLLLLITTDAIADDGYTWLVRDTGGRVDWGVQNRIAFDQPDGEGWAQIWSMAVGGSQKTCLSCGRDYPKRHNGNPAWHPSGKYIVYQALDARIKIPFFDKLYRLYTGPGAGVNNNIAVMTADGARHWQLTDLGKGKGVLHPHFSHDGKKLLWAQMESVKPMPLGSWVMKLAVFAIVDGAPGLSDIRSLNPGEMQFYETHSFSPDDREILFTGKRKDKDHFDIYKYDLETRALAALTDESQVYWDEHAQFSPDGKRIVWMSSEDNDNKQSGAFVRTDWWIMEADGSHKHRLTRFNKRQAPEYMKGKAVAADNSWSPDGRHIVGYLEDDPDPEHPGHIVVFAPD